MIQSTAKSSARTHKFLRRADVSFHPFIVDSTTTKQLLNVYCRHGTNVAVVWYISHLPSGFIRSCCWLMKRNVSRLVLFFLIRHLMCSAFLYHRRATFISRTIRREDAEVTEDEAKVTSTMLSDGPMFSSRPVITCSTLARRSSFQAILPLRRFHLTTISTTDR